MAGRGPCRVTCHFYETQPVGVMNHNNTVAEAALGVQEQGTAPRPPLRGSRDPELCLFLPSSKQYSLVSTGLSFVEMACSQPSAPCSLEGFKTTPLLGARGWKDVGSRWFQ